MIFEQLRLHVTLKTYVFTPLYEPAKASSCNGNDTPSLTVFRETGLVQLNAPPPVDDRVLQEFVVYGIMGFIQLQAGEYMIVVTGYERVGLLNECEVLRATTFQILPLPRDLSALSDPQVEDEQTFVHLVQDHLRQNTFYFSYAYDLTLSLQKQQAQYLAAEHEPTWRKADRRFFWNRFLCEKLITATQTNHDLSPFILPFIQGFVSITHTVVNGHPLVFALLSRRSCERAGTRYFSRGLDRLGHASNFVETEQIVQFESDQLTDRRLFQMSYVQTRGSVPAVWGQAVNTRYTPRLWAETDLSDSAVLDTSRLHFEEQIRHYGPQLLVNLTNKRGYEFPIGKLYAHIVDTLADPRLDYTHFDFHHECRKMKWHRVQLLIDKLEPVLAQQSYFLQDISQPGPQKMQTSIVRTNCMDCLDRTNVVQSMLAKWVLNRQLRDVGILQSTEVLENDEHFMRIFNNVWADHADVLSIAYSGTGALKTDYTRSGKRTWRGALNDLGNSLARYAKNNYMDGSRQDAIDLFLGNYTVDPVSYIPKEHHISPFHRRHKPWTLRAIPIAFVTSVFLFFFVLFHSDLIGLESTTLYIFVLALCSAVTLSSWRFIQQHGTQFVDQPCLVQLPHQDMQHQPTNAATVDKGFRPPEKSNTIVLDEAELGYELPTLPPFNKKTT